MLLEQPPLRGLLGLAVSSYNLALPVRRGSSGSAGGRLGWLAAVTEEARGPVTLWLRAGVPVHVVQRMAGHKHLATTARYVHLLRGDLDEAAARIGNMLATASAGSPADAPPSAA